MSRTRATWLCIGLAGCLLAAVLGVPSIASAEVIQMDLPTLTQAAHSVVIVDVGGQHSRATSASAFQEHRIFTDSQLRVERVLKGFEPASITLTQPGGTVGAETNVVSDLPEIRRGERCILFLDANGMVVGGYQGKLEVVGGQVPDLGISLADTIAAIRGGGVAQPEQPSHATSNAVIGTSTSQSASTGVAAVVAVPTVSGITPSGANAGTGEQVTISGTGFGTGAGSVTFPNGTRGAPIPSDSIVSWTDNQIVCTVPPGAESGVSSDGVVVTTSGSSAALPYHYTVGFSYSGLRWNSSAVSYRVNDDCPDVKGVASQIKAAFATWNAAGSTFRYSYAGLCSTTAQPVGSDGHNDIYWSTGFPYGVVGWNSYSFTGDTILESDIVLNANTPYHWAAGAKPFTIDIQSAVLHELGHTQQLDDQYDDTGKVMSSLILGQPRTALSQSEINGTRYLWGAPTLSLSSPTNPSQDAWYDSHSATYTFPVTPGPVVAGGYSYVLDTSPGTVPDTRQDSVTTTVSTSSLVNGDNWFHVRARSIFDVWGPTVSYRVRVDDTPPVTTSDALPSYPGTATITLAPVDTGCGVARTDFSVDGGVWATGTVATVGGPGAHTLAWASVDNLGNAETTKTVSFTMGDGIHLSATTLNAGWSSPTNSALTAVVPYGGSATLAGMLRDATATPMAGEPAALVIAEYLDGATWKKAGPVSAASAPGQFTFAASPRVLTTYRLHFLGDANDAPALSVSRRVLPAYSVSKPSVPRTGKHTKSIAVSGVLAPVGPSGSVRSVKLSVYQWRKVRGRRVWSLRKTVWTKLYARDASSSRYAATFRISSAGKWSVIAVAPADATHAGSSSGRSSTIAIR